MNVFDFICVTIICVGVFMLGAGLLFMIIAYPINRYMLNRPSNKIQWRCQEDWESSVKFKNGNTKTHTCCLDYRVLPSELNWFTRVFGDNDWIRVFYDVELENENDFLKYIDGLETIKDIDEYLNKERNHVLWIHP